MAIYGAQDVAVVAPLGEESESDVMMHGGKKK
jgi:hypothetical protein